MEETKKEYIIRILNITRDYAWYSEVDTFMREYNNFIKAFNFDEIRGGEIEKIFIDFHNKGITPAKLVELKQGKKNLEKQLLFYGRKAKQYFKKEIKKKYYNEIVKTRPPKEAIIELMDLERIHSLTGNLSDASSFLEKLDKLFKDFMNELYNTVDLIFSGKYEVDSIKTDEFNKVVDEEITFYQKRVSNYEKSFEQSEIYYVGKNDNPYKNIFLYCMNSYIRNFYPIDIVTMQPGIVGKLNLMIIPEKKEQYGLKDVAKAYSDMSGETYDKAYEKMKKQFRKSLFMQKHKKGRYYQFDCIEIPLATYIYYSKKNHIEPKYFSPFEEYDKFIDHYYAPLLRANMCKEYMKLKTFNKYVDFVKVEFKKLTKTVNDAYLDTLLEELLQTSLHLKYRCMGCFDLDGIS